MACNVFIHHANIFNPVLCSASRAFCSPGKSPTHVGPVGEKADASLEGELTLRMDAGISKYCKRIVCAATEYEEELHRQCLNQDYRREIEDPETPVLKAQNRTRGDVSTNLQNRLYPR